MYDTYASTSNSSNAERGDGDDDRTLTSRSMLIMLNELNCYQNGITADAPVSVMAEDNPDIMLNGVLDMQVELSHLEMVEVIIGCAVYENVPDQLETVVYDVPSIVESAAIDSVAEESADNADGVGDGEATQGKLLQVLETPTDAYGSPAGGGDGGGGDEGGGETEATAATEGGDAATEGSVGSGAGTDSNKDEADGSEDATPTGADESDASAPPADAPPADDDQAEKGDDGEDGRNDNDLGDETIAIARQTSVDMRVTVSQQGTFGEAPPVMESGEFIARTRSFLKTVLQ